MTENQDIWDTSLFTSFYVHHKLQVNKYTATKQLVYSHLLNSLSIYTVDKEIACIKDGKFPLHKGRDDRKILYISGVALWLSKSQNQKPMEVANAIASDLLATCGDVFSVQIVPPGLIYLELTHFALAAWLQSLAVGNAGKKPKGQEVRENIPNPQPKTGNSAILFSVQYSHARCCSLVQLAHKEKLIKLQEPQLNTSPSVWNLNFPNPIPWLNCDRKLRLNHSAESRLIAELVEVVDDLESDAFDSSINWEKAALNLSQAFDTFWCKCRIWGEVRITLPELAQARLGLVMATQSVLKFLLEEKLGIFAPWEL
jgi:arginyl-tRNA synthetase